MGISASDLRRLHSGDPADRIHVRLVQDGEPVGETVALPVPQFRGASNEMARPANQPPPASDRSKNFLRALLAEREGPQVEAIREALNAVIGQGRYLDQRLVSNSIDALKALPKKAVDPVPEVDPEGKTEADIPADERHIWPGTWTIATPDGERTFKVIENDDFAGGSTVLAYLAGRDNENDFKGFAFIKGDRLLVWKRFRTDENSALLRDAEILMADPMAAAAAVPCMICGRKLSRLDSIGRAIGPECAKKGR